jgi:hypothetical protein
MASKKGLFDLIFGLSYAAIAIPLAICGALSVAALNQFALGYVLFAVAGVWALGHWCISDIVREKRRLRRYNKPGSEEYRKARGEYWTWLVGGLLIVAGLTVVSFLWTHNTKMGFERDQVAEHLEVKFKTPDPYDVLNSKFSVANRSSFEISDRHQIVCMINLVVNGAGWPLLSNMFSVQIDPGWVLGSPHPFEVTHTDFPIKAHGDTETDSCLSVVSGQPVVCADIVVDFAYYLNDQPSVQDRREREVFTRSSNWIGQPLASKKDFCYDFLSAEGKSTRDKQVRAGAADFSLKDFWGPKQ